MSRDFRPARARAATAFGSGIPQTGPVGRPDAVKFTLPLNPFRALIVMVVEPAAPWRKVKLAGDAERVKLGRGEDKGQLFTKLEALTVPMPVAKSQPVVVP